MVEQYKLRLGDGTILAVDYDGLRSWLLDGKAMVQPPGSRRWRPLRQHLAEEPAPPVRRPEPPAPPPPVEAKPVEVPVAVEPVREPPPSAPRIIEAPIVAPTPAPAPPRPAPAPPRPVPQEVRAARPVLTSLAESPVPLPRQADDGIAIIPLKPLDDDEPPFHIDSGPGQSLLDVAVAEVDRHAEREDPWQWSARDTRERRDTRHDVPIEADVASPGLAEPEEYDEEAVLEEIELDTEDEAAPPPPASAPRLVRPDRSAAPRPAAAVPPATVPPPVEAVLRHVSRWMETGIRRARQLASPNVGTAPPATVAPSAAVGGGLRRLSRWMDGWMRRARRLASPFAGGGPAPSMGALSGPREALSPPPALSELPALRLKPIDDDVPVITVDRTGLLRSTATWAARALVVVAVVGAAVVAISTRARWMPKLSGLSRSAGPATRPLPPPPARRPEPPPLPREVQLAIAQLPHLSPETVQLVMSKAERAPDPPEVFRRAHAAANRGASVLTEEEARELEALKSGALAALSRSDRDRVRAYDRMSPVRDLLVAEDAKVMAAFARGVRSLSAPRRERLRGLLGKAIAAELAPRGPVAQAGP
jgi:hypothetical protein